MSGTSRGTPSGPPGTSGVSPSQSPSSSPPPPLARCWTTSGWSSSHSCSSSSDLSASSSRVSEGSSDQSRERPARRDHEHRGAGCHCVAGEAAELVVEPLPHLRDQLVGQLGGPHGDPDRDRVGLPDRRRRQDAVGSARGFQHRRLRLDEGARRQQRRLEQVAVEQHPRPVTRPVTHPAAGVVVVARQGQRVLARHGHAVGPAGDLGDDRLGGHGRPRTTETRRATSAPSRDGSTASTRTLGRPATRVGVSARQPSANSSQLTQPARP